MKNLEMWKALEQTVSDGYNEIKTLDADSTESKAFRKKTVNQIIALTFMCAETPMSREKMEIIYKWAFTHAHPLPRVVRLLRDVISLMDDLYVADQHVEENGHRTSDVHITDLIKEINEAEEGIV